MNSKMIKLINIIKDSKNIVFFGGAGVSVASGIPDFRSSNGIFSKKLNINFSPEQLVSHSFYIRYPKFFFEFYKENLIYKEAKPNSCHIGLSKLEKIGKVKAIITQNIDGLHQMAGSKNVFELHGSILRNYCTGCGKFYDETYILDSKDIPLCNECNQKIKPDVILYEEGLDDDIVDGAIDAILKADTLIIGGTSLVVYPAAGLIDYFLGKNLILINKSETSADSRATLVINDDINKVFASLIKELNL